MMQPSSRPRPGISVESASFLACMATILELEPETLPVPAAGEDPASGGSSMSRWLGGLGLGTATVAEPTSFAWAGPWIARIRAPGAGDARVVVMCGVPSGATG